MTPPSARACSDLHSLVNAHTSMRASIERTRGSHRSHSDHTPTPRGKRHNRDTKASHLCLRRRLLSVKVRLDTCSAWWNVGHFFPPASGPVILSERRWRPEEKRQSHWDDDRATEWRVGLKFYFHETKSWSIIKIKIRDPLWWKWVFNIF